MPTFEELLMDSMPLAAADTAARTMAFANDRSAYESESPLPVRQGPLPPPPAAGSAEPTLSLNPKDLLQPIPVKKPFLLSGNPSLASIIQVLSRGQSYKVDIPPITGYDDPESKNIWAWEHDGAEPSKISNIWCRVRSSHYISHMVLEALQWGLQEESDKGTFWKFVRITTTSNVSYKLPLINDYMNFKAVALKGAIVADQTPFWRLYSAIDKSLVMAFVYKLKPDGTTELMPQKEIDFLGKEFMPNPQPSVGTLAAVNRALAVATDEPRVMVILSLTVCKQRADFEPIDIVGMGRLFPHILVMANVPLTKIEGSVLYDRPSRITHGSDAVPQPPQGGVIDFVFGQQGCCKPHDGHNDEIGAVLVADANDFGGATMRVPGPLPFWGNMFSYYMVDAYNAAPQETFHMIRTDRSYRRSDDGGLAVRHVVTGDSDYKTLLKLPRQGEFDNIHIAPSMVLKSIDRATHYLSEFSSPDVPLSSLDLSKIFMAPFCSHDCFHTHWRWGLFATAKQALGFDGSRPYAVAGAPQVPSNQDIRVWLRGPNKMTYHATANGSLSTPIEHGRWSVIMHHGSAYALDITALVKLFAAQMGIQTFAEGEPLFFATGSPMPKALQAGIPVTESFSLFYWRLRWHTKILAGSSVPQKVERVSITNLRAARDL